MADAGPRIRERLSDIERQHNVRVLYAAEAGSRAWGFASPDSDYDVRFIYCHPHDWYLSVYPGRDVIEEPIVSDLDISGWDIRKALALLAKGNPPLSEWLAAPVVYVSNCGLAERMGDLQRQHFSVKRCIYYYLHMAGNNYRQYIAGKDMVRMKKYLYVLRPLLACRWALVNGTMPPVSMLALIGDMRGTTSEWQTAVNDLLARKQACQELDDGPAVPVLSRYCAEEIDRLADLVGGLADGPAIPTDDLDQLFRRMLCLAWGVI